MDMVELKGHIYLIIIDYYSRWIEIAYLQKTTSGSIVNSKSVFSCNGIPELVISDNVPQFTSWTFQTVLVLYVAERTSYFCLARKLI